jgi:hypothetical protein
MDGVAHTIKKLELFEVKSALKQSELLISFEKTTLAFPC